MVVQVGNEVPIGFSVSARASSLTLTALVATPVGGTIVLFATWDGNGTTVPNGSNPLVIGPDSNGNLYIIGGECPGTGGRLNGYYCLNSNGLPIGGTVPLNLSKNSNNFVLSGRYFTGAVALDRETDNGAQDSVGFGTQPSVHTGTLSQPGNCIALACNWADQGAADVAYSEDPNFATEYNILSTSAHRTASNFPVSTRAPVYYGPQYGVANNWAAKVFVFRGAALPIIPRRLSSRWRGTGAKAVVKPPIIYGYQASDANAAVAYQNLGVTNFRQGVNPNDSQSSPPPGYQATINQFLALPTPCTSFTLNFKNRPPPKAVASATWSAGVVTLVTTAPHGWIGSTNVVVAGCTPSAYNTNTAPMPVVGTITGPSTLTYPVASDPGPLTVVGTINLSNQSVPPVDLAVYQQQIAFWIDFHRQVLTGPGAVITIENECNGAGPGADFMTQGIIPPPFTSGTYAAYAAACQAVSNVTYGAYRQMLLAAIDVCHSTGRYAPGLGLNIRADGSPRPIYRVGDCGLSGTGHARIYRQYLWNAGDWLTADEYLGILSPGPKGSLPNDLPNSGSPNTPVLGDNPAGLINMQIGSLIIAGARSTGQDDFNLHLFWSDPDIAIHTDACSWARDNAGLPMIMTACGQKSPSPDVTRAIGGLFQRVRPRIASIFGATTSQSSYAYANTDGSLNSLGQIMAGIIAANP